MKKLTLKLVLLTALVVAFASCKKDPDYSVILSPTELDMKFGQTSNITPVKSEALEAKSVDFKWKSDNPEIASVEPGRGGVGVVTANRVGETKITYYSVGNKKISVTKSIDVVVTSRNMLLNDFKFNNGASENDIAQFGPRGYTKNEAESTNTLLVYSANDPQVPKLIYSMNNGKLNALYIILSGGEGATAKDAEEYLEERFVNTKIQRDNILFYKNEGYVQGNFPINSVAGIFLDAKIGDKTYPLGVKVMDGAGF